MKAFLLVVTVMMMIGAAAAQPVGVVISAAALVELVVLVVGWLAATWVLFFGVWRLFLPDNPFLAARVAYSVSVPAALLYLALVYWPKYLPEVLPRQYAFIPIVGGIVVAGVVIIMVWANYRNLLVED